MMSVAGDPHGASPAGVEGNVISSRLVDEVRQIYAASECPHGIAEIRDAFPIPKGGHEQPEASKFKALSMATWRG
ncbi:hypothetical protein FQZ97_680760 [compost metagenome]